MKDYEEIMNSAKYNIVTQIDRAYHQGYTDATIDLAHEESDRAYQRGLNEAWEAAKWLYNNPVNLAEDIFNCDNWEIYSKCTVQEVVHKIKEYEDKEQQKQDAEQVQDIQVGDEVILNGNASYENEKAIILANDGTSYPYNVLMSNGDTEWLKKDTIESKTGRNFSQIAEVLEKMRGEE